MPAPTDLAARPPRGPEPAADHAVRAVRERHQAWRRELRDARLQRGLRERYPVVAMILGDRHFPGFARAFALAHPPPSPVLAGWGEELPGFLAGFAPTEAMAYLPDVARLERAVWRCLHAADAPPMSHADLSIAAMSHPEILFLRLHPGVDAVRSEHPVLSIWARRTFKDAASDLRWQPESVVVMRLRERVYADRVSAAEAVFVAALKAEKSLARARAEARELDAGFDSARLLGWLLARGQITGAC